MSRNKTIFSVPTYYECYLYENNILKRKKDISYFDPWANGCNFEKINKVIQVKEKIWGSEWILRWCRKVVDNL